MYKIYVLQAYTSNGWIDVESSASKGLLYEHAYSTLGIESIDGIHYRVKPRIKRGKQETRGNE